MCLAGLVARAVEANDEPVAHQLVAAHTGNRRQVLDPVRRAPSAQPRKRGNDEAPEPLAMKVLFTTDSSVS